MGTIGENNVKPSKEDMIEKLVVNLPALRAKLGITQADLADSLGIGKQTLLAIENRRGRLRWDTFLAAVIVFSQNEATSDYMRFLGIHLQSVGNLIHNDILDKRRNFYD